MAARLTRVIEAAALTVLVLSTPAITRAQNAPIESDTASPPHRQRVIYDYHQHQPRQMAPSAEAQSRVDNEVKALLKQSDELGKSSNDTIKSN